MLSAGVLLLAGFVAVLLLSAWPLGVYLSALVEERLPQWLVRLEQQIFVWQREPMSWGTYAVAIVLFNLLGGIVLFSILECQDLLPLNPGNLPAVPGWVALNTSISFITNTNWQAYAGETTLSMFSQMVGLTVQNFLSAANGIAVAFVLMRALVARTADVSLGNFWTDLWRITVYLLLPASILYALFLSQQGVVQSFLGSVHVSGLDGVGQQIPLGPVASQEAIKMLGTNGGGYFNANSAHPFENPTGLTNFVQMVLIVWIPTALCFCFGRVTGKPGLGRALVWCMGIVLIVAAAALMWCELQQGGNWEGKETRFGILASSLFATVTTAASNGAVNAMHESLSALGGMIPMLLMQLGEIIFGGVGSGWYGMMLFVFLTVFLAGLMIGRSPEYLGKKIDIFDMKMVVIAILLPSVAILLGTAIAIVSPSALTSLHQQGPHGFSEMLYAFSSAANNNGSAFAGLNAATPFMTISLSLCMILGRFGVMFPVLAIAGSFLKKRQQPESAGSLVCHGPLFVGMLIGVIILVGLLTFIPALFLGPIVEHLQWLSGFHGVTK